VTAVVIGYCEVVVARPSTKGGQSPQKFYNFCIIFGIILLPRKIFCLTIVCFPVAALVIVLITRLIAKKESIFVAT